MGDQPPEDSIPTLISRLIDDGKLFVRSEVDLYRARLTARLGYVRNGAILVITALWLAQAILVAGLVGLLLILAPRIGPGWATLAVVLASLAVTGILAWLGWVQIHKAIASDDKGDRK